MASPVLRVTALLIPVWIGATAALFSGCSILFHADATQCETDGDCRARGGAFVSANFVQCQAGTCVQPQDASTTDSAGPSMAEAGREAEAEAGPLPCMTYSDCPSLSDNHPEVTCDPDSHTCVQLTTDQCPLVLGDYQYSKSVGPAIIGAFSLLPTTGDLTSYPCTLNYELAVDEFTSGRSGVAAGPNASLRMPVIVVCNTTSAEIDTSMQHLTGDLKVPAVIAALPSADLKAMFSMYGYEGTDKAANVFVVNPFGADSTLTALPRGQQFWHMLGLPGDTAPAYEPLLARVEAYIRNNNPGSLGAGGSLKVSTVTANATVLNDLARAVLPTLQWNNGSDTATSGDANYDGETIPDSVLNGTAMPDISAALAGILKFQPHVVISFASDEFVTLLQTVEIQWPSSMSWRPLWILSSYNYQNQALLTWVGGDSTRQDRVLGVNFASTTQTQVLTHYQTDFTAANPGVSTDYNNCYDATYFAIDSLVATSNLTTQPFTGSFLGQGMLRLITVTGTPFDMGAMDIDDVAGTLTTTSSAQVELIGTLGDPLFSTTTGARASQGDVYCIEYPVSGPPPMYEPDAMRLVVLDGGTPTLSGTPCFPGL